MDHAFIEGLLDLFERSALAELEYSEGDRRLRLVKQGSAASVAVQPQRPAAPPLSREHVVRAGLAGLFFRRPAPSEPPFVSVGDIVTEGQKLGILEAMKTLNPIESDRDGRISKIGPEDGTLVAVGEALFVLTPTDRSDV